MASNDIHNYDDVDTSGGKRRGKGVDSRSMAIIVSVVIIGVLLSAAIIIIWYVSFRPAAAEESTGGRTAIVAEATEASQTEGVSVPLPQTPSTPSVSEDISQQLDEIDVDVSKGLVQRSGEKSWFSYHTMQKGETLDTIAALYDLKKETILGINAVRSLSSLTEGVELKIPVMDGRLYTVQSGDSLSIITSRFNPSLGWQTLQDLNDLNSADIFPGQQLFIPDVQVSEDGSLNGYNRFTSPYDGTITGLYNETKVYGDSEDIVTLKGIWVKGNKGDEVHASSSGVVVDTANDVERMGRFVTLSHENGYRTTYAHLETVNVAVSDQVKQGDVIGTLGDSGSIITPTLYFSIEQDGVALDPLNFF